MRFPSLSAKQSDAAISFEVEDVELPVLTYEAYSAWLSRVAGNYGFQITELTYIFCSDEHLHKMNVEYLQHDTYTDIITFDLRDDASDQIIEGECYLSVDRIRANASASHAVQSEFQRVLVHGLLHLCGLQDKTPDQQREMRAAEDESLAQLGL